MDVQVAYQKPIPVPSATHHCDQITTRVTSDTPNQHHLPTGSGRTSWPVSRILCTGRLAASRPAVIHLGLPSPAGSSGLPAGIGRATLDRLRSAPLPARLLALLQVGFTEPSRSPGTLVVSYTTVSPLPRSHGAVCFLWHYPAGHPGLPLATTLP